MSQRKAKTQDPIKNIYAEKAKVELPLINFTKYTREIEASEPEFLAQNALPHMVPDDI